MATTHWALHCPPLRPQVVAPHRPRESTVARTTRTSRMDLDVDRSAPTGARPPAALSVARSAAARRRDLRNAPSTRNDSPTPNHEVVRTLRLPADSMRWP